MNRWMILILVTALVLGYPLKGNSKDKVGMTGNDLLVFCGAEKLELFGVCAGMAKSFAESHVITVLFLNKYFKKNLQDFELTEIFCIPPRATNGQLGKVVEKYLNNNPERLHNPFGLLVFEAFIKGFPCPNKRENDSVHNLGSLRAELNR